MCVGGLYICAVIGKPWYVPFSLIGVWGSFGGRWAFINILGGGESFSRCLAFINILEGGGLLVGAGHLLIFGGLVFQWVVGIWG